MTRRVATTLVAAGVVIVPSLAPANTSTTNEAVSASVTNNCTIGSATLGFGGYDPVGANASTDKTASTTVSLTCTNGAATTIDLDQGANPKTGSTATVPLRQLASGTKRLQYYLYQNSGLTTVWGASTATKSYTGIGTADTVSIYGKITAGQNTAGAGSYADAVTITINF